MFAVLVRSAPHPGDSGSPLSLAAVVLGIRALGHRGFRLRGFLRPAALPCLHKLGQIFRGSSVRHIVLICSTFGHSAIVVRIGQISLLGRESSSLKAAPKVGDTFQNARVKHGADHPMPRAQRPGGSQLCRAAAQWLVQRIGR